MACGTVESYWSDEGWGVIASDELPARQAAWIHFSAIEGDGFRELRAGDGVEFDYEPADQDGYRFRATYVRRR